MLDDIKSIDDKFDHIWSRRCIFLWTWLFYVETHVGVTFSYVDVDGKQYLIRKQ